MHKLGLNLSKTDQEKPMLEYHLIQLLIWQLGKVQKCS